MLNGNYHIGCSRVRHAHGSAMKFVEPRRVLINVLRLLWGTNLKTFARSEPYRFWPISEVFTRLVEVWKLGYSMLSSSHFDPSDIWGPCLAALADWWGCQRVA